MDRESLKKSGLLEQYILGLTNRKEALLVEKMLEDSPGAREDYEKLRQELDVYAANAGMAAPLEGREIRTAKDYEDLDHEMILAMTERNHSLVIWRYSLMAACLLLLCLSGYLFRLSESNRTEIVTEKAHHAQDNNAHEQALQNMKELAPDWAELKTVKATTTGSTVILHYLDAKNPVLLDFSHAQPLNEDDAYFVLFGEEDEEAALIVRAGHQIGLHPVLLSKEVDELKVFRWKLNEAFNGANSGEDLVAALSLPAPVETVD